MGAREAITTTIIGNYTYYQKTYGVPTIFGKKPWLDDLPLLQVGGVAQHFSGSLKKKCRCNTASIVNCRWTNHTKLAWRFFRATKQVLHAKVAGSLNQ